MNISRYGVHETHCCETHGCKYGDEDCPVVLGIVKQKYECESCLDEQSHWQLFSENPPEKNGYYLFSNPNCTPFVAEYKDGKIIAEYHIEVFSKYWTTYPMVPTK